MKTNQLGWMRTRWFGRNRGSPAANSVTQLVDTVVLNYLALQGQQNLLSQALAGRRRVPKVRFSVACRTGINTPRSVQVIA